MRAAPDRQYWDIYDPDPPVKLISGIKAWRGEVEQWVPAGTYADLGEPKTVLLEADGDTVTATITSPGDSRWSARLAFRNDRVEYRKVWYHGFEDEGFAETKFSYIEDN